MINRLTSVVSTLLLAGFLSTLFAQQQLPFLRRSSHATVSQNIATFAKISIDYSRPLINDREVWGTLVPFGLAPNGIGNGNPMPWRSGANENTVITFSHDVKIEGKDIKAGVYSIHMIPSENDVTVIFNKDSKAWGSYFYERDNDAARVKVKWQDAPHAESLTFAFEDITQNSASTFLHWGKKKIAFKIEVDRNEVILAEFRSALNGRSGFNQAAYGRAATFCINNKINLEQAEVWADRALAANGGLNFNNRMAKSNLLALRGMDKEAAEFKEQALSGANEVEMNAYGYTFLFATPSDINKALEVFKGNVDRFPDSWNVYDSYAEALGRKGDKNGALKNYEIALEKAPAAQHARIENAISSL